mgnify:CR=1 FL=1
MAVMLVEIFVMAFTKRFMVPLYRMKLPIPNAPKKALAVVTINMAMSGIGFSKTST